MEVPGILDHTMQVEHKNFKLLKITKSNKEVIKNTKEQNLFWMVNGKQDHTTISNTW